MSNASFSSSATSGGSNGGGSSSPPVQNISVQNGGAPHDGDSTLGDHTKFMIRLDNRRHRQVIWVTIILAIITGVVVPVVVTQMEKDTVVINQTTSGGVSSPPPAELPTTQSPTAVATRDPSAATTPTPTTTNSIATESPTETSTPPTTAATTGNPTRLPTRIPTSTIAPTPLPATGTPLPSLAPTPSDGLLPDVPWKPLGQELGGKAEDDSFGASISLSRDARVLAVGASQTLGRPGYVSIFEFDESTGSWVAKGQELVGEADSDSFGWSVALNGDGSILAVGAYLNDGGGVDAGHVRVFQHDMSTNRWVQLGSDMNGEGAGDLFGWSLSLSKAGDILAVGARYGGDNKGSVRMFQYERDTESWEQLGQTLVGQAVSDWFGYSISLSSSGNVVAVGARDNGSGGSNDGQVSMYQYKSESSEWNPMGSPINGQVVNGYFGGSVSLDDSGLVVAMGAPGADERVLVHEYNSATSQWTQRGQMLESQQPGNRFGDSVSLSGKGDVLAVGSPYHYVNGLGGSGQVTIFQHNVNTVDWDTVGESLNGKAARDWFGTSVSLSEDGTVVAVGAIGRDYNGIDLAGSASVHTLN